MRMALKLTPTSVIVLGLVEASGEATPYELKQGVAASVGNFWSVPHSQLYAEPERLAEAGYLSERREEGGRRRRVYRITPQGRRALEAWRRKPPEELGELREPGLLKLFFGADPQAVARTQVELHRAKLAEYEERARFDPGTGPRGPWLALQAGIRHTKEWIAFWGELAKGG
jgi:PadR family transcriptional regulator, regulatory protein AphA